MSTQEVENTIIRILETSAVDLGDFKRRIASYLNDLMYFFNEKNELERVKAVVKARDHALYLCDTNDSKVEIRVQVVEILKRELSCCSTSS